MLHTNEVELGTWNQKRLRGEGSIHKWGGGTKKHPVFGIFERSGEVYTQPAVSRFSKSLSRRVSLDAVVHSNGWKGCEWRCKKSEEQLFKELFILLKREISLFNKTSSYVNLKKILSLEP